LYWHLADSQDEKMYNNTMINALLKRQNYQKYVFVHFVIYVCQLVFVTLHHLHVLFGEWSTVKSSVVTALACLFLGLQLVHEVI
jgi:hypothetical protein